MKVKYNLSILLIVKRRKTSIVTYLTHLSLRAPRLYQIIAQCYCSVVNLHPTLQSHELYLPALHISFLLFIISPSLLKLFPHLFSMKLWDQMMILVFWMLSFKPTFSLSSFTFIKRLFSSLLSAFRVVSSAYLRLLTFLLAILIPAYATSGIFHDVLYI